MSTLSEQRHAALITREVLLQATLERKADHKLAEELGVPIGAIQHRRRRWHIKSGCLPRFALANVHLREKPIPEDIVGCVVGGVLGDGTLRLAPSHSGSACFAVEHCEKQHEWLEYKRLRLGWLVNAPARFFLKTSGFAKGKTMCRFWSVYHPQLGELRRLFYDATGRKQVTKQILDLLTAEGLAWWFFDDGNHNGSSTYTLAVNQCNLVEVKLIREMLRRKFGILTSIMRYGNQYSERKYYNLYFAHGTLPRLLTILRLLPVKCMYYKIDRSSETIRQSPQVR